VYWDEKQECMPIEPLRRQQLANLQATVARCYERVPFYRRRMDEKGVKPQDVRSLDDLRLMPFISKHDLREGYPFGLFAVGLDEVVRIHSSSGTTGKPVVGATRATTSPSGRT